MPDYPIDLTLEQIRGFAEDIGDEIVETDTGPLLVFEKENENKKYDMYGDRYKHNGKKYLVCGHPELRLMVFALNYEVQSAIENKIKNKRSSGSSSNESGLSKYMAGSDEVQPPELALSLLSNAEKEKMNSYEYKIEKVVSHSDCNILMLKDNFSFPQYLIASRNMFPYRETFSIREFDQARGSVLRCGRLLQRATERAFSVTTDPEQSDSLKLEIDTDRM
jgi:hypothetical protein